MTVFGTHVLPIIHLFHILQIIKDGNQLKF